MLAEFVATVLAELFTTLVTLLFSAPFTILLTGLSFLLGLLVNGGTGAVLGALSGFSVGWLLDGWLAVRSHSSWLITIGLVAGTLSAIALCGWLLLR